MLHSPIANLRVPVGVVTYLEALYFDHELILNHCRAAKSHDACQLSLGFGNERFDVVQTTYYKTILKELSSDLKTLSDWKLWNIYICNNMNESKYC